jgi:hypothetical protein
MTSRTANAIRARIVELCEQYGADNVHVLGESEELATVLVTECDPELCLSLPLRFFSIRPERCSAVAMTLLDMKMDLTADGSINFSGRFVHPPADDPLDAFTDALCNGGLDGNG